MDDASELRRRLAEVQASLEDRRARLARAEARLERPPRRAPVILLALAGASTLGFCIVRPVQHTRLRTAVAERNATAIAEAEVRDEDARRDLERCRSTVNILRRHNDACLGLADRRAVSEAPDGGR